MTDQSGHQPHVIYEFGDFRLAPAGLCCMRGIGVLGAVLLIYGSQLLWRWAADGA